MVELASNYHNESAKEENKIKGLIMINPLIDPLL